VSVTDSFLVVGAGANFGALLQPDDCGNNVEVTKAIKSKNLRMIGKHACRPGKSERKFCGRRKGTEFRSQELQELQKGMTTGRTDDEGWGYRPSIPQYLQGSMRLNYAPTL